MAQSADVREPILASWKISEVLWRYPETLEILLNVSPAFAPLRNPLLRRVQSRLVTVAQAAQIAGLESAALVHRLNLAVGLTAPDNAARGTLAPSTDATPPWVGRAPIAVELDARRFHRRGEEPFQAIMTAVARVPVGWVFRLRNTFEPVPLYDVLGKRGFIPWTCRLGPDDWEVWFLNDGAGREQPADAKSKASQPKPSLNWATADSTLTIDVRDLVPPEPMIKILETLTALPPGGTLLVRHVRRPMHLYPRLDELGYRHETRELGPEQIEVLIQKPITPTSGEEQP